MHHRLLLSMALAASESSLTLVVRWPGWWWALCAWRWATGRRGARTTRMATRRGTGATLSEQENTERSDAAAARMQKGRPDCRECSA